MLLTKDPIFCDPKRDLTLPVIELKKGDAERKLDKDHFYLIGDIIYRFVENSDNTPGTIIKLDRRYFVIPYDSEDDLELYNVKYILSKTSYERRLDTNKSFEDICMEYANNIKNNNNLIQSGNIKITPSGEVYMPELDPDDDPLERIVKLMLRHMKLVLNDYRGSCTKKHWIDNIKSALNGATKNMSITKFMGWCDNFGLIWEFVFTNTSSEVPHPLKYPIVIRSDQEFPWEDIPPETKTIFTVPLVKGEDPLKRAIKLALFYKLIDLKDYRHKSPTPHLINNMKSAIKSKQKMTLPYNISWCEIIDLTYSFRIIGPDGIWYKIVGYDVTTNAKESA